MSYFTNSLFIKLKMCSPVQLSLQLGIDRRAVIILSISLLKYLITRASRGYSWVLTSLLPSVAQAYGVYCSFSAIELVVSLARLPIIAEVLVQAHPYFFAISESGYIFLNKRPARSLTAIATLCSIRKFVNKVSAFVT